jgi:hypothetical protein
MAALAPASTLRLKFCRSSRELRAWGWVSRIGRHLDIEPVAGFLADKADQLVGIAEFARIGHAGRQVATQGDDVADTVGAVGFQNIPDVLAGGGDAREMRRGGQALALDFQHGFQGPIAGGTAGAESHGKELGVQLRQLPPRVAQLFRALGGLGREEFDTESSVGHGDDQC